MAGRGGNGPPPKPPGKRAGHRKDPHPTTTVEFVEAEAPDLPDIIDWHPQTLVWWDHLRESPLAKLMMATDWDFMVDTAMLHTRFWFGSVQLAGEIRLRVAKLGVTPEDRLRLRIQAVQADEADSKRAPATDDELFADIRVLAPGA